MPRPTLEEIFAEPDEFGLLAVRLKPKAASSGNTGVSIMNDVTRFYEQHGRLPYANSPHHEEMRLGTIWENLARSPTDELRQADRLELLGLKEEAAEASWRDEVEDDEIPDSLDDIFADDGLDVQPELIHLKHVTPAAERQVPDHRADFVPCKDFDQFVGLFETMQHALDSGAREATLIEKWAIIEPVEGDFFIRNGLLAYIAEKSESTQRGGARDHRLRVIFSNGTESDPLMSSFRKSLNDDKTARVVQRLGLGPLDPDWEADKVALSGTVYVARSLSEDPAIKPQRDILYKIGVTSQNVQRRVADARNDPTFLLAPVDVVAIYELQNLSRSRVENLLHRFFDSARPGELFIIDRFGKKIRPREWFYVMPAHVGQAANLIKEGQLHLYRYDRETQRIVKRS
ncbi:GIY-YIG nuclease domain-containing protein [Rhizobium phaseoli]|uniref:GIY-YIG nuclease family protein n=1 Tax=Rhizobium phaseoli TaxID=396 RepID=UPI0007E9C341|nr:GIY-YIG nuclease family protein [Rhizobium phaseoli]ANL26914.1 GIY-YIG nuclease domain-containing protein [Rhizobium phaseoli]